MSERIDVPITIGPDEVYANRLLDLETRCKRLDSNLERCHKESVELVQILMDVATVLGQKKESNYATIKALKGWATGQVKALKFRSSQEVR